MADSLVVTPDAGVDSAKPADASVSVRQDTGGRAQVRVALTAPPSVDPADKKPESPKDEKQPEAPKPEAARPEWLPAKFQNADAMKAATLEAMKKAGAPAYAIRGVEASDSGAEVAAVYAEFEKKLTPDAGKPREEQKKEEKPAEEPKPEQKPEEKPAEEAPVVKSDAVKAVEVEHYGAAVAKILDDAGIIGADMAADYNKTGKIDQKWYDKLAKAGVSKGMVDAWMIGSVEQGRALAAQHISDIKASVGGEDAFGKLAVWGAANMSKEQSDLYNTLVNSGSMSNAKEGVRMLKGWYDAANGSAPRLQEAVTAPRAEEPKGYRSRQEVMKAMSDPRYKAGDKAYHAEVEEKLKHTTI